MGCSWSGLCNLCWGEFIQLNYKNVPGDWTCICRNVLQWNVKSSSKRFSELLQLRKLRSKQGPMLQQAELQHCRRSLFQNSFYSICLCDGHPPFVCWCGLYHWKRYAVYTHTPYICCLTNIEYQSVGKFVWSMAAAETDSAKEAQLCALYLSIIEWNSVLLFLKILNVRSIILGILRSLANKDCFGTESRCSSASIFIQ